MAEEDDARRRALPPARGALAVHATVGAEGSAVAAVARTRNAMAVLCIFRAEEIPMTDMTGIEMNSGRILTCSRVVERSRSRQTCWGWTAAEARLRHIQGRIRNAGDPGLSLQPTFHSNSSRPHCFSKETDGDQYLSSSSSPLVLSPSIEQASIDALEPEQRNAVVYDHRKPLLISAGAGSGKTRVMTL